MNQRSSSPRIDPFSGPKGQIVGKIGKIPCGILWVKHKKEEPIVGDEILVYGESRKEFRVRVDRIENGYYYHLVDLDGNL